uniref:Uncharacterized protein n=1 Tax=mine drainage metagenome TaxID=410659 RepID=E6QNJ0_9ZZZZ
MYGMATFCTSFGLAGRMRAAMIKPHTGEVAEWSNVPDSKSGVAYSVTEGSNPSLSAS